MKIRSLSWLGLVGAWLLAAGCGSESQPAATSKPSHDAGTPDADAEAPPPPLAPVQGVPELEDVNPDPYVVEVSLAATKAQVELVPGHMTNVLAFNGHVP